MRVKFLFDKRYPHPSGQKRRAGDVVEVDDEPAQVWIERGVVEDAGDAKEVATPDPLTQQPSGDLRQTTAQTTVENGEVVSNAEPQPEKRSRRS